MRDPENPVQITDIEAYIANVFSGVPDDEKIKTRLQSSDRNNKARLGCRPFSAAALKQHLRNHTANADKESPYILNYFLCQQPISVFSRAPDRSEWT